MSTRNGVQVISIRDKEKKKKTGFSLHVRLFLLLLVIGMVPVLLFNQALYRSYLNSVIDSSRQTMEAQALILTKQLVSSGYMESRYNAVDEAMLDQMAETWDARIRIVDDHLQIIKDTQSIDDGRYCVDSDVLRAFNGEFSDHYVADDHLLYFVEPITTSDADAAVVGAIIVNVDTNAIERPILEQQERAWMLEIIIFCGLVLAGGIILYFMLKPLKTLAVSIRHAAEGSKNSRVDVRNYSETARISDAFNLTWDRMQSLDQSRQDFVSNVAHELKTPITSVRVLADSLTSMGEAPVELYQEFMADISTELDRESKIIDDLLSLSRLENSGSGLNISKVNINEMLELVLKRLVPIADTRAIELKFESFRPVKADVDEVKLNLAITNLVENGIKYNKEGGIVRVTLNSDYQFFYIKVTDTGCGIPEDAIDHIFERFYRVDKARSRDTGGTGLGLPISKSIIGLHHGAIKAYSKPGEGTTFVVRIPLNYIADKEG